MPSGILEDLDLGLLPSRIAWTRRHVVVLIALALIPAFAVTAFVSASYHREQRTLAADWAARGDAALDARRAGDAIEAYRNALTYARGDRDLHLRLARALSLAGRDTEARSYLLTLWADQPGNGPVNLELARLAAAHGDITAALRYYHGAIEGAWTDRVEDQRRLARIELLRFLIAHHATVPAHAEVIALEQDLPENVAQRKLVARLMAEADVPQRALAVYVDVLRKTPKDAEALAAAGLIEFDQGNYRSAAAYLTRAIAAGAADPRVGSTRDVAELVLSLDPLQRRLSLRERARRTERALEIALSRLRACPDPSTDPAVIQLRAEAKPFTGDVTRRIVRDPEQLDAALDLAFRVEQHTDACMPPRPADQALQLVAKQRQAAEQ